MTMDQSEVTNLAERAVAALERETPASGAAHAVLSLMMEATSPATETEFFRFLVKKIATALGVNWVFVTECLDDAGSSVRMLASWSGGDTGPTVDFALTGTPCEEVIQEGKVCFYPKNIGDLFPREKRHGQQSYIGVPIFARGTTRVIGHIAIFDKKDMTDGILRDQFLVDTVLRIFSERAGAEIIRMQLTRDLTSSAENYRLILDHQNEFVVKIDENAHLSFVSPSYCRALERDSEDLLGTFFPMPPDLKVSSAPTSVSGQRKFEDRILTKDGWRWIAWDSMPVSPNDSAERQLVLVGRDVTDQKIAEEEVREHFQTLARVARRSSLSEMSTAIAHEINQPLASILTYAQACLRISHTDSTQNQAIADALKKIASNAERAGEIIRRLRAFARDSSPKRVTTSINHLVREVKLFMQPEVMRHGIELVLVLDPDLGEIEADVIQIQQVLVNLIQNAIDSLKVKPQADQTIVIKTQRPVTGRVVVDIEDQGGGVQTEIAMSLFDPFITTKQDGLGIGLSISRSIVNAHGGDLSFAPLQPNGARFRVSLPVN